MLWPWRTASDCRSSTSRPTPSENPVPSAPSENALQRPSEDTPRCREISMNVAGVDITATPPASASDDSPVRSDCAARCIATSEEEQAVSIVTAGPSRPST